MASTLAPTIAPDIVMSFEIIPGTLPQFLEAMAETKPRIKCFEGTVTLVSAGMTHGIKSSLFNLLLLGVGLELGFEYQGLGSTTWSLPLGAGDTAYEADLSYYVQSFGRAKDNQPPDLAIEIVVSHSEVNSLRAGAFLKIPEMWVYDIPRHRLTFHILATRGKHKGAYRPAPRSLAFPVLRSAEVLERFDEPETDDIAFMENCQAWARRVLVPRLGAENGGA